MIIDHSCLIRKFFKQYSLLILLCFLTDIVDIPVGDLHKSSSIDQLSASIDTVSQSSEQVPIICVCRRGNDSQLAVQKVRQELSDHRAVIKDIKGGLTAWAKSVDPNFPTY